MRSKFTYKWVLIFIIILSVFSIHPQSEAWPESARSVDRADNMRPLPPGSDGPDRGGEREEREERSGERALITAQQSEIRPRSEQISAELPALITHHTSALSSIHSISVIKIETIQ